MSRLDVSLSGTQELVPLGTRELELPRKRPRLNSRSLALGAFLLLGLGLIGAALVRMSLPEERPGPRDFQVLPGLHQLVAEFSTDHPVIGAVEVRIKDSDLPPARHEDREATRDHRFLLDPPQDGPVYLRAVAEGESTLEVRCQPLPPLRVRLQPSTLPPGEGGTIRVESQPPLRGSLILLVDDREAIPVELTGEPGSEEGRLPAPGPRDRSARLRYQGRALDDRDVEEELPFTWGGLAEAGLWLTGEAHHAREVFEEMETRPAGDFVAAGVPVGAGAKRRPDSTAWVEAARDYFHLQEWVLPRAREVLTQLRETPSQAQRLARDLSYLLLLQAGLHRDGGEIPPHHARDLLQALLPRHRPEGTRTRLSPPGSTSLHPALTGLPQSFFGDSRREIPLRFPELPADQEVTLEVIGGHLEPDFFFLVRLGEHRIYLSPGIEEPEESPRGTFHYRSSLPAGWLPTEGSIQLAAVVGSLIARSVAFEGAYLIH